MFTHQGDTQVPSETYPPRPLYVSPDVAGFGRLDMSLEEGSKKPVVSEHYDEFVFNRPSPTFRAALEQGPTKVSGFPFALVCSHHCLGQHDLAFVQERLVGGIHMCVGHY